MNISFDLYRAFYHIASEQSISRGAEKLHISQPAASQALRQLETQLGCQLFFRKSRGVRLTRNGEMLLSYIEQAFRLIKTGERKIEEILDVRAGEIVIGAGDTLSTYYLSSYLETYHTLYPGIRIRVINRTTRGIIELLKDGTADLGILNLPVEDSALKIRQAMEIQDAFVVGKRYRHLAEQVMTLEELAGYPLLLLERRAVTREFLEDFFRLHGVGLTPEVELGSIDLLCEFARIGLGISCVIRNFVTDKLERKELFEIPLAQAIPKRHIGVATLRNLPLVSSAERLLSIMDFTEE